MSVRQHLIKAGFGVIGATGLHRLAAPLTRGVGAILMFHHVRPAQDRDFAPNRLLDVTPAFLEETIGWLRRTGYDIVTLDEALTRLGAGSSGGKPFVVLTFDDGYRDNVDCALPILERHRAPATFYVTTGFADRTARLWWVELEQAIRATDRVRTRIGDETFDLPAGDAAEKRAAFDTLYWRLRQGPEEQLLDVIAGLCAGQGVVSPALVERDCLDWSAIAALADHPLITWGAHTLTHPMLAKHPEARVERELADAKAILEQRLKRPVRHLAYPVGDRTSAAAREFDLARRHGYASAVTTRPGLLFPAHAAHPTALPRVSVNGNHQTLASLDILLSGAAFALWNRGRRVDAA